MLHISSPLLQEACQNQLLLAAMVVLGSDPNGAEQLKTFVTNIDDRTIHSASCKAFMADLKFMITLEPSAPKDLQAATERMQAKGSVGKAFSNSQLGMFVIADVERWLADHIAAEAARAELKAIVVPAPLAATEFSRDFPTVDDKGMVAFPRRDAFIKFHKELMTALSKVGSNFHEENTEFMTPFLTAQTKAYDVVVCVAVERLYASIAEPLDIFVKACVASTVFARDFSCGFLNGRQNVSAVYMFGGRAGLDKLLKPEPPIYFWGVCLDKISEGGTRSCGDQHRVMYACEGIFCSQPKEKQGQTRAIV